MNNNAIRLSSGILDPATPAAPLAFSESHERNLAAQFGALACPIRLKVFMALCLWGPQKVGTMCARLGLAQPTLSHHLGLLRMHGLIENRRDGKCVWYSATQMRVECERRPVQTANAGAVNVDTDDELRIMISGCDGVSITLGMTVPKDAVGARVAA